MKKVIFAYAGESERMPANLNELRSTLDGNVEFVEEDRLAETSPDSSSEWVVKKAKSANFIVIFFAADKLANQTGTSSATPITAGAANLTPSLAPKERARLPEKPTVLTVVFSAEDRNRLPADLVDYPVYDVSTSAAREAFLCRLVHDPVKPTTRVREEAASAVLKMTMAGIATLVGANDKTKDFLLDQFGETVSQAVHYCMAAVVLVMIFAGLLALLRLGVNQVRPLLNTTILNRLPGGAKVWRKALVGVAMVLSMIIGVYFFPNAPRIDENLSKHLKEWTHQLQASQSANGGIHVHVDPTRGIPQVWTTAQSLAGLLSSQAWATMSTTNARMAFTFIERTRIVDLEFRPDKQAELAQELKSLKKQVDFEKLPAKFPTFATAVDTINRIGWGTVVSPELIELLDLNRDKYFSASEPLEGWGYHDQFDWGVTEIAGWVAIAEIQSLRATNPPVWTTPEQGAEVKRRVRSNIELLRARQMQIGAFSPIKDASAYSFARTYSTIMALWAMAEAASPEFSIYKENELADLKRSMSDAVKWLGSSVVSDKGWIVNPANPTSEDPFLGLTAQTLSVLGRVPIRIDNKSGEAFNKLKRRLLLSAGVWTRRSLKPNDRINDRMHDSDAYLYPTAKTIELSTFLWYPWTVSLLRSLSTDPALTTKERQAAAGWHRRLQARAGEFGKVVEADYNYLAAETLVGFEWPMDVQNKPAP